MKVVVSHDGSGDFETIGEAAAASGNDRIEIFVKNGLYREKLALRAKEILIFGEDPKRTVISFGDGARHFDNVGDRLGTFRSYTLYFGAERAMVKNLTVRNTAGKGDIAGQAIAVYADAALARFEQVHITGRQDTLFLAPLPEQPRIPGSFVGPGEHTPRRPCVDYFRDCQIEGDVDFIFGGAQAAFENCDLFSRKRGQKDNGYVIAPCTPADQDYGFIFYRCRLLSDCPTGTVYLGRPWREYARAAFLQCELGSHILEEGWSDWDNRTQDRRTVRFEEYKNFGPGAVAQKRVPWARMLSDQQAVQYMERLRCIDRMTAMID